MKPKIQEEENCLSPYREIYKGFVRKNIQTKITAFLNRKENTQNLNVEKNSKSKDNIRPKKTFSFNCIILKSHKKENC